MLPDMSRPIASSDDPSFSWLYKGLKMPDGVEMVIRRGPRLLELDAKYEAFMTDHMGMCVMADYTDPNEFMNAREMVMAMHGQILERWNERKRIIRNADKIKRELGF